MKKNEIQIGNSKKVFILFLFLLIFVTMSPVFAGGNQEEQKTGTGSATLVVWMPAYIDTAVKFMRRSAAKAFPEKKIEITPYPMDTYSMKFSAALAASSDVPDVMIAHERFAPKLISGIVDITDRVKPMLNDLVPSSLGAVTDANGRIYGLPFELTHTAYFYREDIYNNFGIGSPKTIDDYIAVGKKLKSQGIYADLADLSNGAIFLFEDLLLELNGNYFDINGNIVLGEPKGKGIEAVTLFKKIVDTGMIYDSVFNSPDWFDALKSGKVASHMFLSWYPKKMRVVINNDTVPSFGKWRITKPPVAGPGLPEVSIYGDVCAMINKNSKQTDLAWNYIKFLTLEEKSQLEIMNKFAILGGSISNLKKVAQVAEPWPLFGGQKVTGIEAKLILKADNYMQMNKVYFEARTAMQEQLALLVAGKKTPRQVVDTVVNKTKKAMTY